MFLNLIMRLIGAFCILLNAYVASEDCIVSEWSSWGSCSKQCSDDGIKTSNKTVVRPASFFGKQCPKAEEMSRSTQCGIKNNGCEQFCDPLTGNCECKSGLILDEVNNKRCVDHNECIVNFGRGPCNQKCVNTHGSYHCLCNPSFFLAEDKHSCHYNSTSRLCDLDIREYNDELKCVCKDRSLEGLKCNKKKDKCKTVFCSIDSTCVRFRQSKMSCFSKKNLIPILHPVPFDNYQEEDFRFIVELYITRILENIQPKAPLFGDKPDHSFIKGSNPKYYYVEALDPQKIKTFTFVQYAVYNIEKSLSEATRTDICSRLQGTDIHCLNTKECNIVKSQGRSCTFVYDSTFAKQENDESSKKVWLPITICLVILLIIIVVAIIFIRRRKIKWQNLTVMFNSGQNEEVSCPDNSSLLNRNEPPPPYRTEDTNLQHIDEFDANVFSDEPLNKDPNGPVYESIPVRKPPGYEDNYESMDSAKNKKCDMVELPENDDDAEPRYIAPVNRNYVSHQGLSSSSTSEPHYAVPVPVNNQEDLIEEANI